MTFKAFKLLNSAKDYNNILFLTNLVAQEHMNLREKIQQPVPNLKTF